MDVLSRPQARRMATVGVTFLAAAGLAAAPHPAGAAAPSPTPVSRGVGVPSRGVTTPWTAVSFTSVRRGWVLSADTLLRTGDGGRTWQRSRLSPWVPQPYSYYAICATGRKTAWLLADNGVWHTTDAGDTWRRRASDVRPTPVYDTGSFGSCTFVDDRTGWLAGGGTIVRTSDGGRTWQRQLEATSATTNALTRIVALDRTRAIAGLNRVGGHVVIGIGLAGTGWAQLGAQPFLQFNPYRNPDITDVAATSPSTFWVGSRTGEVFRSLNQGVDFSDTMNRDVGVDTLRSQGLAARGSTVILFGSTMSEGRCAAVTSVDGGATWQWSRDLPPGTVCTVADVELVTPMKGWAVAGTRVLRTVDGGQSWAVVR